MVTGPALLLGQRLVAVNEGESWQAGQFSHCPGQMQDFELVHPNIYPIRDLLERVKGPVPWNQSPRISVTQGNNMLSKSCLSEDPD